MIETRARPRRIALVMMGVAGSGKTSVGTALARELGIVYVDGDDLHPAANVAKMQSGVPLTDDDRWPWLDRVAAVLADRSAYPGGIAVGCSALRRAYRDRIREGAAGAELRFLFLDVSRDEAQARMQVRKGHFMPPSLLRSQFETLEVPTQDETDVLRVEETPGVEGTVAKAVEALRAGGAPA